VASSIRYFALKDLRKPTQVSSELCPDADLSQVLQVLPELMSGAFQLSHPVGN
jgi:hypothetical protein